MSKKKEVIIIGAGPAGLTAANYILENTDYKPIILEASNDIGGISKTVHYKENRIDIGGHRFFSKVDEVNRLWNSLMPMQGKASLDDKILGIDKNLSDGPDPESSNIVMLKRRRVSRIYYLKKFFNYPISISIDTIKSMGIFRTMKAGFGYIKSVIFKKEETNLKNFYINRFGKPLYEMFFEDYTEKLWGINPSEIDASWGAQRVKGLSLTKAILNIITSPFKKNGKNVETSLIEEFSYPKYGPGQLWEVLADKIVSMGGSIIMNCPVEEILHDANNITGVVADSKTYKGDAYFSSMPIKDLVGGMKPSLSKNVSKIANELPYRDFVTVGLLVDKLKIKNNTKFKTLGNIVPDCWIYIQDREVKLGRLQIFNNWSPYMVKDPENTVWIGLEYFCNEEDFIWKSSDEDFIDFATKELVKIGIIDADSVKDSIRIKVKKAYPAYFGSYNDFDKVRVELDKFDNLYCIGRNGQHRYNNMDHSMMSAYFAVEAFKNGSDKDAVWSVNTEKEYHEKK